MNTPSGHPRPLLLSVRGKSPRIGEDNWLAPNCTIVGDVVTGTSCSVWFGAVVRGDVCAIRLGDKVNVQDGAVLHGTWEKSTLEIGDGASIGHNATVHGCRIEAGALIGMGAVVMDHAVVGKHAVIGAGAVVLEGTVVGPGEIWAGVPARKVKNADVSLKDHLSATAERYRTYARWFETE